ncbi:hypothetical protein CGZ75_01945 [Paenibacillus herberti]|uniref:Uncharacterized protein n=1 Tax=Paenibacillus herberti TaxID=1619309 RepID=A0A229NZU9_9BACL|nr:hypothetical protein CGZ75_01945 [Paenibacillus herberti]
MQMCNEEELEEIPFDCQRAMRKKPEKTLGVEEAPPDGPANAGVREVLFCILEFYFMKPSHAAGRHRATKLRSVMCSVGGCLECQGSKKAI